MPEVTRHFSALLCGKTDISHENKKFICKVEDEAELVATLGVDLSPREAVMGKPNHTF